MKITPSYDRDDYYYVEVDGGRYLRDDGSEHRFNELKEAEERAVEAKSLYPDLDVRIIQPNIRVGLNIEQDQIVESWEGLESTVGSGDYTGTFAHGNSVTISGSGFGTNADITPETWEDFESYNNNDPLGTSPTVGDATWSRNGNPKVITTYARGGAATKHLEHDYIGEGINSIGIEINPFSWTPSTIDTTYIDYWVRMRGTATTGTPKMCQFHGTNHATFNPQIGWGGVATTAGSWFTYVQDDSGLKHQEYLNTGGLTPDDDNYDFTKDAWHHVQLWGQQSTAGVADGQFKLKIDNVLKDQNLAVQTRDDAADGWELTWFMTLWANVNSDGGTAWIYVDECWCAHTWCRVVITDTQDPDAASYYAIQRPTAWSDTSVTIVVNQGHHTSLSNQWCHVYDNTDTKIKTFQI